MVTPKRLFDSLQLGATSPGTALYTAPAQTRCIVKKLTFSSTDASTARTVSVYIVRSGQAAALDDAEVLWKTKTLAPLESKSCYEAEGHVLEEGDMLYAVASAATSITAHGSGVEITK